MIVINLLVSVIAVSGETNFQPQRWVTKILSETLDDYVPDGGIQCRRHGLEYQKGIKDLKLWAVQSKFHK